MSSLSYPGEEIQSFARLGPMRGAPSARINTLVVPRQVGDQIRELTNGLGADCGAECVGYQCHDSHGKEVPTW